MAQGCLCHLPQSTRLAEGLDPIGPCVRPNSQHPDLTEASAAVQAGTPKASLNVWSAKSATICSHL